jgi:amidophosphoribosyltransferase
MTRNSPLRPNALSGDSELGESLIGDFDMLRDEDRPQEECGVFGIFAPGVDVARRTFSASSRFNIAARKARESAVSDGRNSRSHRYGPCGADFNEDV